MLLKGLKKDTLACLGMSQFQHSSQKKQYFTELSEISKARHTVFFNDDVYDVVTLADELSA